MCQNGQCLNMEGSYKCVCNTGYTLSDDGLACIGGYINDIFIREVRHGFINQNLALI